MLLTKREIGELSILKILIEEKNYSRKKDLLKQLNMSISTIKRHIQSLNETLSKINGFQNIKVVTLKDGYLLNNPTPLNNIYVLKKINLFYHENSIQFKLISNLFSTIPHPLSIDKITKELAISSPYVYKLLQSTNKNLEMFDLHTEFVAVENQTNTKISIIGNTMSVFLFELHFYFSIYQGLEWIFPNVTMEELYLYCSPKELEELLNLSLAKQTKFFYSLAIFNQKSISLKEILIEKDFADVLSVFMAEKDLSHPLRKSFEFTESSLVTKDTYLFFNYVQRIFNAMSDTKQAQIRIGKKINEQENNVLVDYCKIIILSFYKQFPETKRNDLSEEIHFRLLYFLTLFFANIFYVGFDSSRLQQLLYINPDVSIQQTKLQKKIKNFLEKFLSENPSTSKSSISSYHLNLLCTIFDYFIYDSIKDKLNIYIQFSKNLYGQINIESWLTRVFGEEKIRFSTEISSADIIISDFYEETYQSTKYFYFDNLTNKNRWEQLYAFVHEHQLKLLD
ncbi:hypothetical protein RV11_GL003191 [Enterococcus phoeniculicola]|uniref:Uncharacterized protein n=1 Tax=Enterococcus phoeniculicola ATCC BAA-412 TaxID=1158610 RepID=R3WME2_9ENTE|nr:HTH domain-containing protein [Enterococcus phoeniculicola]EOL42990.1 hypothetical protein UC3_01967 [Enterococcus phoeniculicola ATCC BAA-412]EOT76652.1 hypothetical protein I589_01609 [Enterococcus phoeniculicola ATCC BAA-412]OJG72220.1 hypothetical protein RV11_GL003191 [Enterococcus phoeniculicola]